MFKKGDAVYYYQRIGSTFRTIPATIVKMGKQKIKIRGDFPYADEKGEAWVNPISLESQGR